MDGGLAGLLPEGALPWLIGRGTPVLGEAQAAVGLHGGENFVRISAGIWPVECSHHFTDRGSVP